MPIELAWTKHHIKMKELEIGTSHGKMIPREGRWVEVLDCSAGGFFSLCFWLGFYTFVFSSFFLYLSLRYSCRPCNSRIGRLGQNESLIHLPETKSQAMPTSSPLVRGRDVVHPSPSSWPSGSGSCPSSGIFHSLCPTA